MASRPRRWRAEALMFDVQEGQSAGPGRAESTTASNRGGGGDLPPLAQMSSPNWRGACQSVRELATAVLQLDYAAQLLLVTRGGGGAWSVNLIPSSGGGGAAVFTPEPCQFRGTPSNPTQASSQLVMCFYSHEKVVCMHTHSGSIHWPVYISR